MASQIQALWGLLLSRWPVLITDGTAARLLEQTATDLGAMGADGVYGSGFINLVQAFQPIGSITTQTSSGGTITLSSTSGTSA